MRFLIDLQCAQSVRQPREVGQYALSLLDAMLPAASEAKHEVHVLLNSAFPTTIPDLQRRYPELHAKHRIHIFHGLTYSGLNHENGLWRKAASDLLRDFAIASLSPDAVIAPSLLQEDGDTFVLSALVLSETPTITIHHDLVSAQALATFFDTGFLSKDVYQTWRASIHSCPALIAVSKSARQDALQLLDYPTEKTHVISGGADTQFITPDHMSLTDMEDLRTRYTLLRRYMLYVGSGEPRQNLTGLIRAYNALPQGLIESYDLVIAGKLTAEEVSGLNLLAKDLSLDPAHIRILDQVHDTDLPGLYGLAALFVMPSFSEGFSLPALEAIRCGTLTLGANTASLPEIIGTPETLFEPEDILGMAALIKRGLTDVAFSEEMRERQMRHAAQFSWKRAAQDTLSLLERYGHVTPLVTEWPILQTRLDELETQAIAALQALPIPNNELNDHDQNDLARALLKTRLAAEQFWRPRSLPEHDLTWRLEGPFDSNYSLASVNRETARALSRRDINVALFSAEGGGPFDPDSDFLDAHPDLAEFYETAQKTDVETTDILSRNMFPPRVSDMQGPLNVLHGYAWEETGLPQSFTRDMTAHLQGLLVTTSHVKKLFEDAGVGLPVHVVGNGVDHLDVPPAPLPITLPQAEFTCLHVSSCFPRKGADVLLAGFATAFEASDDVHLVIKTFHNPHNDIAAQISALRDTYPNLPPITVIETDLTPGQMRSLYASADLLIAPSRAEGYCLPVAEAVLAGTPVLTTGWGGQKIFSDNPLVSFIDYTLVPAQSHLGAWDSVWAEPDQTDFVNKLQAIKNAQKPSQETSYAASSQILKDHTWDKVAERSERAVRQIVSRAQVPPPSVGWISSYNTRCGIAAYSEHLINAFPDRVTIFASETQDRIVPDDVNIRRCWRQDGQDTLTQLQNEIRVINPQVLVIQFNYGFFSFPHLAALILQAKADGRQVVMMLHATDDSAVPPARHLARIRPALEACDRLLVHSHHDLNRLKSLGLEDNVALFPHGVPYAAPPALPDLTSDRPVVFGTYGFFLPPKGLDQLIEAIALVRRRGENVALEMINAEFPIRDSIQAIDAARKQIEALGLDAHVNLETGFLEDAESFARLSKADALVFPYQNTAESASGAIRQALALDRPVIASPLRIFDDVDSLILRLPGTTSGAIADGLFTIAHALRAPETEPEIATQLRTIRSNVRSWRESHAYQVLSPRLWRQICSVPSRV